MMVDPNDPAVQQAAAQDPGFFQRLMSNGVLGMNASEALLRFGSGLLSGDDWNQGLSRAASSLVQGGQQARAFQNQQAMAERRFQEARLLQNERLAAQERISGAGRQALTPYQRGGQVFRDPQTGAHYESVFDARTGSSSLVPVGGGAPLAGQDLATVQPRLVRASQEVTSGLNRLQQSAAERLEEIRTQGAAAFGAVRDVDTALEALNGVSTGGDIPSRAVRALSGALGININGTTPERLDVLSNFLGQMSAEQRRALLQGLQPVSQMEFQSAEQALMTLNTNPDALRTLLSLHRRRLQNQIDLAADIGRENVDQLVQQGRVRDWEFQWQRGRNNPDIVQPRVEGTGGQQPPRLQPAGAGPVQQQGGAMVYVPPERRGGQQAPVAPAAPAPTTPLSGPPPAPEPQAPAPPPRASLTPTPEETQAAAERARRLREASAANAAVQQDQRQQRTSSREGQVAQQILDMRARNQPITDARIDQIARANGVDPAKVRQILSGN